MEISDIIGKSKMFEPPFSVDARARIVDKNNNILVGMMNPFVKVSTDEVVVQYICDLLNRDYYAGIVKV